jgi:predicted nucleic acid-binding protein
MTNVVDSSAWVEYFCKGSNARVFLPPLQDTQNLVVPAICLYEVFKKVHSQFDEEVALQSIAVMTLGQVVELDRDLAVDAALVSLELKLPMADSIIYATARACDATLWTQDGHFKGLSDVKFFGPKRV